MRMLMLTLFASLLFAQAPSTSAPPGNAQNGRKLFENYGCYQSVSYTHLDVYKRQ